MITINLLPWRNEELSKEIHHLKRIFALAILGSMILVIVVYCLMLLKINVIENQINGLNNAQNNVAKNSLQNRLMHSRPDPEVLSVAELQTLFFILDNNQFSSMMCFTSISRHHHQISFLGTVNNAAILTDFLKSSFSKRFAEIHIMKLVYQSASKKLQFQLDASQLSS